jgi:putative transposase
MGKMSYLATSDGELIDNPRLFVQASGKLKWLQPKLKRKKKGSRCWRLIQHRIAQLYEHVTKSRKDFFLKWSHHLCHQADSIFAEALNLKALGRSWLAKYCLDAAWAEFLCFGVAQHKSIFLGSVSSVVNTWPKERPNRPVKFVPTVVSIRGESRFPKGLIFAPTAAWGTHRDVAAAQVVWNRGVASTSITGRKNARRGSLFAGDGLAHSEFI